MELSERKKKILKSVVDSYINSGEPVGSKYLTTRGGFDVSSATIRNEMNELETMGFLEQPHTSAGRVPTALGYRTYIDSLMEKYLLSIEELNLLNELSNFKVAEINSLLEKASRVISEMTNYTSFAVIKPSMDLAKRYEAIYIDDRCFLLIMLCENETIKNRNIKLKNEVTTDAIPVIQSALNKYFINLTADNITMPVILQFEEELGDYSYLSSVVLRAVYDMLATETKERVYIEGVTKLLSYPEFNSIAKAKDLLEMIEEKSNFYDFIKMAEENRLNVYIGNEDNKFPIDDSSFVFKPISVNGQTVGVIGVIGPKRMDYKKVFASLNYLTSGFDDEENYNEYKGDLIKDEKER